MEDILNPEAIKELGFGGAMGFIVGFTLKRILKFFLLILGLYILSLVWLADNGVITVNWGQIQDFVTSFFESFNSFARNAIRTLSFGSGFAVGFAVGMKV